MNEDLSDCRVLIVDDVKSNVDVLVHALRDDYKLSVALNGEVALRSAEKNPPDLVLLDILMPGMNGYEVCQRLRAGSQNRDVPVMFLSSLEEVANKALGFEVGGNDYLTKPFEIQEVKARVRSLLKAKAYSDAVKEKMASELRIAREIQHGFLPSDVAAAMEGTGLEISAVLEPAKEVGGDLYEVVRTDDGRIVIALGDVSGKGIPAALFMAVATTLIRMAARRLQTPEQIVLDVSDALASKNPQNMFVTLFCAVFDLKSRSFRYASAGHPSPVILRPGSAPSMSLESTAMMAGLYSGMPVESRQLDLRPGDTLVIYSDGITEAFNAQGDSFGDRRLVEHLAGDLAASAAAVVAGVVGAVRQHAGDQPQSDDITVVAVRYNGAPT
ncbi:MAG: SpoIIE family protein phosphatase [Gemmataceae bacterium]